MAQRLRTTSALAVVVLMLVGACTSSATTPPPTPGATGTPSATGTPAAHRHAERNDFGRASGSCAEGPDWLYRAGQGTRLR